MSSQSAFRNGVPGVMYHNRARDSTACGVIITMMRLTGFT